MRSCKSLVGGFLEPGEGFGVVQRDRDAGEIGFAHVELGLRITGFGFLEQGGIEDGFLREKRKRVENTEER